MYGILAGMLGPCSTRAIRLDQLSYVVTSAEILKANLNKFLGFGSSIAAGGSDGALAAQLGAGGLNVRFHSQQAETAHEAQASREGGAASIGQSGSYEPRSNLTCYQPQRLAAGPTPTRAISRMRPIVIMLMCCLGLTAGTLVEISSGSQCSRTSGCSPITTENECQQAVNELYGPGATVQAHYSEDRPRWCWASPDQTEFRYNKDSDAERPCSSTRKCGHLPSSAHSLHVPLPPPPHTPLHTSLAHSHPSDNGPWACPAGASVSVPSRRACRRRHRRRHRRSTPHHRICRRRSRHRRRHRHRICGRKSAAEEAAARAAAAPSHRNTSASRR